jgi:hypothetical protein
VNCDTTITTWAASQFLQRETSSFNILQLFISSDEVRAQYIFIRPRSTVAAMWLMNEYDVGRLLLLLLLSEPPVAVEGA